MSANKQKSTTVNTDPLFVLAELLIKIDKRAKIIKPEDVKEASYEDKRSPNNTD